MICLRVSELNHVEYDARLANNRKFGDPEVVKVELGGRMLSCVSSTSRQCQDIITTSAGSPAV